MRNFSIVQDSSIPALDQYADYLKCELYRDPWMGLNEKINDPVFLQQMSLLQANSINKAVQTNGAILYENGRRTDESIKRASRQMSSQIASMSSEITSSLETGFCALNTSLCSVDSTVRNISDKIDLTNQGIDNVSRVMGRGFASVNQQMAKANDQIGLLNQNIDAVNHNLGVINQNIGAINQNLGVINQNVNFANRNLISLNQTAGLIYESLKVRASVTQTYLDAILNELRIPETQRERRYHIENGIKYLSIALKGGDKLYFEDALDEFNKSLAIERKDYLSWYYLAFIYSHSLANMDLDRALDAYERFFHYAEAEYKPSNNVSYLIDDAHFNRAEIYYIQRDAMMAAEEMDRCRIKKQMAAFYKAKYLSSTGTAANQEKAADIIYDLLSINPYMSMRVLEDRDLLANSQVGDAIGRVKSMLYQMAVREMDSVIDQMPDFYLPTRFTYAYLGEAQALINKGGLLDMCEAISKLRGGVVGGVKLGLWEYIVVRREEQFLKKYGCLMWDDIEKKFVPRTFEDYLNKYKYFYDDNYFRIVALEFLNLSFCRQDAEAAYECLLLLYYEYNDKDNRKSRIGISAQRGAQFLANVVKCIDACGDKEKLNATFGLVESILDDVDLKYQREYLCELASRLLKLGTVHVAQYKVSMDNGKKLFVQKAYGYVDKALTSCSSEGRNSVRRLLNVAKTLYDGGVVFDSEIFF